MRSSSPLSSVSPSAILAVAAVLAVSACAPPPPPAPDRNVEVVEIVPVHTSGDPTRFFDATVRARHEVSLAFTRSGRLAALTVDVGDHVRTGQVLGQLVATRTTRQPSEGEPAATVRHRAGDGVLVARRDGIVTARMVEPGAVVAAGSPVVRIAAGAREAEIRVPGTLHLPAGTMADVRLLADGSVVPARLRQFTPEADPGRLRTARFRLLGGLPDLPIDGSATLVLRLPGGDAPSRVPLSAVADVETLPYVWRVDGPRNVIHRQRVRIVDLRGRDAIVAGLRDGLSIVATATDTLSDGQAVVNAGVEPGFH